MNIGGIMPYKRIGKKIMVKRDGWEKKAVAKSEKNAKRMLNLLRGLKHGWTPTRRKKR